MIMRQGSFYPCSNCSFETQHFNKLNCSCGSGNDCGYLHDDDSYDHFQVCDSCMDDIEMGW